MTYLRVTLPISCEIGGDFFGVSFGLVLRHPLTESVQQKPKPFLQVLLVLDDWRLQRSANEFLLFVGQFKVMAGVERQLTFPTDDN